MQGCTVEGSLPAAAQILPAKSTPLASIFGSGFLVIVLVALALSFVLLFAVPAG